MYVDLYTSKHTDKDVFLQPDHPLVHDPTA